jgi:hypothetical protein
MHECEECGQVCACDCDDLMGPQPADCRCPCLTEGYDDEDRDEEDGCVLGDRCLCPHPYHGADECFDLEMAQAMDAELAEVPPPEDWIPDHDPAGDEPPEGAPWPPPPPTCA